MNREIDKALDDCEAALKMRPGDPATLDSRALVWLRHGAYDKALADLDLVVKAQPRNAWSLYVRSLAERHGGNGSQADADRAAALAINPNVAARAKRFGLEG